jgi:hypothetical protein
MARGLSNPTVQVNNTTISITPKSFKYKSGKGNKSVKVYSTGGSQTENVISENADSKKSSVQFSIASTKDNVDLISEWQDSSAGVTITAVDGDWSKTFRFMYLVEDPETPVGADEVIPLKFEGTPIVD